MMIIILQEVGREHGWLSLSRKIRGYQDLFTAAGLPLIRAFYHLQRVFELKGEEN
jgi:hypothetical protein